ncbi:hypothetical protein POV27_03180 [Aureisphaera galaxeae]|uniref:hypothetical protein n=1 Tax=Aureisphaera galaxeae TaxID=1538023 RepID=UPI002350F233|nr:hypothetical protein [Aureisphaera galaxeae]MDC8003036.1 hypothetical protein [Aureisphaera galaxeae]
MKKTLFPIAILLLIAVSFVSCERESSELTETQSPSLDLKTTSNPDPEEDCDSEEDMFERQLLWLSATTSRVLRYHPAARTEFLLAQGVSAEGTLSAETLLGDTSTLDAFKAAFEEEFIYYLNPPDPDSDNSPPKVPPVQGGAPDANPDWIYQQYLSIILDSNCVELYFPTGLDLSGSFITTATSHPLTTQMCNEGIKRLYHQPFARPGLGSFTSFVIVDDTYVANNDNVIVARPVRSTGDASPFDPCLYNQYPGIDFTLFLD